MFAPSITKTLNPSLAIVIADERPLGPEPIIIASYSFNLSLHYIDLKGHSN